MRSSQLARRTTTVTEYKNLPTATNLLQTFLSFKHYTYIDRVAARDSRVLFKILLYDNQFIAVVKL